MPSPLLAESIALEIGGQEPWPADVKLYQPYEVEQILLPDNANCLAVQAYLRMCGLHYQIESRANAEFMSPSGTLPFIKCGKYVISELEPIVSFVENKGISLTTNFDDSQKNDMKAYISLINFVLGNSELYVCWVDEDTYNTVTKPRYSSVYPWPLNHIQTRSKRSAVIKHLKAVKYYNKTIEEVYQEVEQCCRSLSDRLDDKEYFFGSNPTELDALLFGHLYSITIKCKLNKLVTIVEKFPTLQAYCKNVWMNYFSSFYDFSLVVCDSCQVQGENISKKENSNCIYPQSKTNEKLLNDDIGLSGPRSVNSFAKFENNVRRLPMVVDMQKSVDSNDKVSKKCEISYFFEKNYGSVLEKADSTGTLMNMQATFYSKESINFDVSKFSKISSDQSQESAQFSAESLITESDINSINTMISNDKSVELKQSKSASFMQGPKEKFNELPKCTSLEHISSSLKSPSSLSKLNIKSKQILLDSSNESNNRSRLIKYLNKCLGMKNEIVLSTENKLNIKEDKINFKENNSPFNKLFDSSFKNLSKSHDNFRNVQYLFRGNISSQKLFSKKECRDSKVPVASAESSLMIMSHIGSLDQSSRSSVINIKTNLKHDCLNKPSNTISEKFCNKEEDVNKILIPSFCDVGTQTSFEFLFEKLNYDKNRNKLIEFNFVKYLPDELRSQNSLGSEMN